MDKKLLAVLLLFALINLLPPLFGSIPVIADANIYLSQAKMVSDGLTPYLDFFFAHPPMMLIPTALLLKLFSFSFTLGAIQPIIGGLMVLYFTYLVGEKIQKNTGLLASFLLIFSPLLNYTSHNLMGVSMSLGLAMAAVWYQEDRPILSGVLSVFVFLVRYSFFPITLVLFAYALWKRNSSFILGATITTPLFLYLLLIPNFFANTLLYHLGGSSSFGVGLGGGYAFLLREFIAVGLGTIAILYFLYKKQPIPPLPLLILLTTPLIVILFHNDLRPWYLLYLLPFLLLIGSQAILNFKWKKYAIPILLLLLLIPAYQISTQFTINEAERFQELLDLPIDPKEAVFDTTISFGPYYSLTKDTHIAGGIADIVPKRFQNNAIDPDQTVLKLQNDPPRYIFDFHRGALPEKPASDSFWRNSALGTFVHTQYHPILLTHTTSDSGENFLVLVWEQGETGPLIMEPTGTHLYKTSFATFYDLKTGLTSYEEGIRKSTPSDGLPSKEFTTYLKDHNILSQSPLVPGTWIDSERTQGTLTSRSWFHGNTLYTETTDSGQVTAITLLTYSPTHRTWSSLEIYQNLYGNFILIYSEQLLTTS